MITTKKRHIEMLNLVALISLESLPKNPRGLRPRSNIVPSFAVGIWSDSPTCFHQRACL